MTRLVDGALALAAAGATTIVLQPTSGQDSNPPVCWNRLGYEVSCDGTSWQLIACVVGIGVLVLILLGRRLTVSRS